MCGVKCFHFNFICIFKEIKELTSNYHANVIFCDFATMFLWLVFAAKATHSRNKKHELNLYCILSAVTWSNKLTFLKDDI